MRTPEDFENQANRDYFYDLLDDIFDSGELGVIDAIRSTLTAYAKLAKASQAERRASGRRAVEPLPDGVIEFAGSRRVH